MAVRAVKKAVPPRERTTAAATRTRGWRWALRAPALALVAVLLVLLAWRVLTDDQSKGLAAAVAAGKAPAAPGFDLPRLDEGGTLRLSSLHGRVVLLNFWASWCIPCKEDAPRLEEAWQRWHTRRVVFLGLDAQDFRSDARNFMRHHHITYPNVHDGPGSIVSRYGVDGFPETWFVSREGRLVVEHVNGPLTAAQIDRDLRLALRR